VKRRTFRNLKAKVEAARNGFHHHVYVVLLDAKAAKVSKVRKANPKRDPAKPCVYVGMTGLKPEERFRNHKRGIKASGLVRRYGLRLLPEMYACFNPMPFEAAVQMERELAEDLRSQGFTVVFA
jgi:hypothetical protein